jgi:hypothetical protein
VPEGHTLHRLATALTDAFAGQAVRVSSPQGRFAVEATQLDGSTLLVAESAGKHLFLDFDADRVVHVHLGLIGGFDVHRDSSGAATTRRTPTCAARPGASWSPRPGARRSSAGWAPIRSGPTPIPAAPGRASRRAPVRSVTC